MSNSETFMQHARETDARAGEGQLTDSVMEGLSPYQQSLLKKVQTMHTEPIVTTSPGANRSPDKVNKSMQLHKRINPGYVDMPWTTSNSSEFTYRPPPDFSRDYLRASSDCKFQEYAAEAILKHVDLKKTSH
mmetsp:Transcript_59900/g.129842  ORF Transcript_59900/g.129842 Transcript_59900/m.129842 type:complete len:132 (-) Transcript_59900:366-761(-)